MKTMGNITKRKQFNNLRQILQVEIILLHCQWRLMVWCTGAREAPPPQKK